MKNKWIGILVAIAITIILTPIYFAKEETTDLSQVALEPPPFPGPSHDQALLDLIAPVSKSGIVIEQLNYSDNPREHIQTQESWLKSLAWVVQVGHFDSYDSAKHLADLLRVKGYDAFMVEKNSNGQKLVFVGPVFKQVAAATLSKNIEHDIRLHGVIKSFYPLEL